MLLYNNILILFIFVLLRIFANDDLCRLIEFDVPESLNLFHTNKIEEKLFYKTDYICQNKPVFRSIKYSNFYQFQSPNKRWWSFYDTTNSTYKLGMREWCDAWNIKPLLSMPLGIFQHPLGKQKRSQRWQRVIIHENNKSYTYKPISNVHIKCYYPPSTSACQTEQLTFLFDLTETTNNDEFHEMKLLTKTLIWLLYNQTKIALSYYSDRFHLINSFDNKTPSKSLEYLFDSIDTINQNLEIPKRFSVRWSDAIHNIVTQIYKRRLLLPINITDQYQFSSNDSHDNNNDDDEIYTEPYPLFYSDEHAIKTILNITTYFQREKRSIKTKYDQYNNVLVILTSRSKYLYDYKQQNRRLAQFISSVPLRILVIDLNKQSNKKFSENIYSAFIHNVKYALASLPVPYNYIENSYQTDDIIHNEQLFDHYHRICYSLKENLTTVLIESKIISNSDCSLLTLFDNQNINLSLKDKFDYTFYQTSDQCFSASVYRSLGDRNIYAQRIANGQWLIIRVDPLLPSIMTIQQKFASTTTSTLPPEFLYATDYANGPLIDDENNITSISDLPISIPYCSNNPGIDILWESSDENNLIINNYSLYKPRQWISNLNQSDLISPICNKYKIFCQKIKYDILILIDCQYEYLSLIQTFLNVFLSLIDPYYHRFSLIILSSITMDTFQYHLPLTTINTINKQILNQYFSYMDHENTSLIQLNQHIERISEYLINNQQLISNISSKSILFTISSRLNFNSNDMKYLIQRYSSIRYMTLDPYLKTDDVDHHHQEREKLIRSLTSYPLYSNLFWSYAANRDLTFNTVFRVLESLCGSLR